jgi:hypothetical protein
VRNDYLTGVDVAVAEFILNIAITRAKPEKRETNA